MYGIGAISELEKQTVDIRQAVFSPKTTASDDIVMVWLDEPTMKALPFRSPVPRDFLATLNDKISAAGPKLIAYDVFFKGASFPESDKTLTVSLSRSNSYAVVPMRPRSTCPDAKALSPEADGCVDMPDDVFLKNLKGVGLADFPFSASDYTVRSAKFGFNTDSGETPTLVAELYKTLTGRDALGAVSDRTGWKKIGPFQFTPFVDDGKKEIVIRFAGPPSRMGNSTNAFKVYSAGLVAKGLLPPSWLKDKVVLVGAAYEDATDAYITPYYRKFTNFARMYGVELHANVLSSLLTGQFLYAFTTTQKWSYLFIIICIVGGSAFLMTPLRSSVVLVFAIIAEAIGATYVFKSTSVIVPIVPPVAGSIISYGFGIGLRALTEGRQKRFIKSVFQRYVPPAVVERMTEHPEMLRLGGEERSVTSMFTDIASFTSISEKMDPTTLVAFLNEYLGLMNEILFKYGATLDKYEGDAIISFFNAPLEVKDHEVSAIRAAIEMKGAGLKVTEKWKEKCGREIITRVGLNTGPAVVGNMGSEGRFDYTAIGDTINLASRLEGTNKFYGTVIMASESTARRTGDDVVIRPVDRVRVKGKKEPILLYEIVGFTESVDKKLIDDIISPYKTAFGFFEGKKIGDAIEILKKIISAHPNDGPSVELLKRCERAITEPSWDMVTDLVSK